MSKIVEFPTHKLPSRKLKNELKAMQDTLRDCYARIDEACEALNEMQEIVDRMEQDYNNKLIELADIVGAENLTLEDLEWASNIKVDAGSEEIQIWFENEQGDQFVFELEEDDPEKS